MAAKHAIDLEKLEKGHIQAGPTYDPTFKVTGPGYAFTVVVPVLQAGVQSEDCVRVALHRLEEILSQAAASAAAYKIDPETLRGILELGRQRRADDKPKDKAPT